METGEISFTDLIASSIHDMKNSLNMQINYLEGVAVECRQRGDTATFENLERVIYQSNRMNSNLIQLLSLYKLGKSIYPIDIAEHSVAEVIEESLLQNKSIMDFKGLAVTVDCDPHCYWYFDRDLVIGVLINALNNAYNYTNDKIRIAAHTVDGCLELRVEDDGRGYPASMLLGAGVPINANSNFLNGSTGLGFYFSYHVARLHHDGGRTGTLGIENGGAYGGGCFVLRLP